LHCIHPEDARLYWLSGKADCRSQGLNLANSVTTLEDIALVIDPRAYRWLMGKYVQTRFTNHVPRKPAFQAAKFAEELIPNRQHYPPSVPFLQSMYRCRAERGICIWWQWMDALLNVAAIAAYRNSRSPTSTLTCAEKKASATSAKFK
jgi:hypothetical protein